MWHYMRVMSCDSTWQHTDDVMWQDIDNDINTTLILHDSTGTRSPTQHRQASLYTHNREMLTYREQQ